MRVNTENLFDIPVLNEGVITHTVKNFFTTVTGEEIRIPSGTDVLVYGAVHDEYFMSFVIRYEEGENKGIYDIVASELIL